MYYVAYELVWQLIDRRLGKDIIYKVACSKIVAYIVEDVGVVGQFKNLKKLNLGGKRKKNHQILNQQQ